MKRLITISIAVLLCFQACDKRTQIIAPTQIEPYEVDSSLICEVDSLTGELFSQIYYSNIALAKQGAIHYKQPPPKVEARTSLFPIQQ